MFYIDSKDWDKILGYAEEAYTEHKSEIGGMSVMVEDKEGDWKLEHPVILKQEISSGNTVLEKDALAEYYTKQARKMGKKNFRFCWWHSHHTMSAFWSGTDKTAIEEFNDGDFSFALVVNLKGEYKFRVSVWKPVEAHEDVDLQVLRPSRITKNISKEVKKFCKRETNFHSTNGHNRNNSYNRSYNQGYLPLGGTVNKMGFSEIVDAVDAINDEATEGTIKYEEYKIQIDTLNTKLKEEKNMYKVELITQGKFEDLVYMWPNQFVQYRQTGDQVYDNTYFNELYGSIY